MISASVSHSAKHMDNVVDLKHFVLSGVIKELLANFFLFFCLAYDWFGSLKRESGN